MEGDARWRWQHEIVRRKGRKGEGWRRVSLTFRVEREKENGKEKQKEEVRNGIGEVNG